MEEALRAALLDNAPFAAACGGRCSWSWRAQGEPLPAVTLTRIGGRLDYRSSGPSGLTQSRVQADCWGTLQLEATTLARALIAALPVRATVSPTGSPATRFAGIFVVDQRTLFEGEKPERIVRAQLDINIWHAPATA